MIEFFCKADGGGGGGGVGMYEYVERGVDVEFDGNNWDGEKMQSSFNYGNCKRGEFSIRLLQSSSPLIS